MVIVCQAYFHKHFTFKCKVILARTEWGRGCSILIFQMGELRHREVMYLPTQSGPSARKWQHWALNACCVTTLTMHSLSPMCKRELQIVPNSELSEEQKRRRTSSEWALNMCKLHLWPLSWKFRAFRTYWATAGTHVQSTVYQQPYNPVLAPCLLVLTSKSLTGRYSQFTLCIPRTKYHASHLIRAYWGFMKPGNE